MKDDLDQEAEFWRCENGNPHATIDCAVMISLSFHAPQHWPKTLRVVGYDKNDKENGSVVMVDVAEWVRNKRPNWLELDHIREKLENG